MLPHNCEALWQAYLASEKVRVRTQSTAALRAFIDDFKNESTTIREQWACAIAESVVDKGKDIPVRMPLFREIMFPVLLSGFEKGEGRYARWLAGFAQLLYNSPDCLDRLPETSQSEHGLLLRAVERDSADILSKQRLLRILRARFEYALHELPAGVLYGADGATPAQCEEMDEELRFFEALSTECGAQTEDKELIEEARFHIGGYRTYLLTRASDDTYESFLARIKK